MSRIDYPASALRICIDEIHSDGRLLGIVHGVAVEHPGQFTTYEGMLLLIDSMLDRIGRPQSSKRLRSFKVEAKMTSGYCGNPIRYFPGDEINKTVGRKKTIDAYFLSRLRGTWQGFLRFRDTDTTLRFESELELLGLIFQDGDHTWKLVPPDKESILRGVAKGDRLFRKKKRTLIIDKKFEQHKTWQGVVRWVEEDRELPFRSALELLRIVSSAGK